MKDILESSITIKYGCLVANLHKWLVTNKILSRNQGWCLTTAKRYILTSVCHIESTQQSSPDLAEVSWSYSHVIVWNKIQLTTKSLRLNEIPDLILVNIQQNTNTSTPD